MTQPACDTPCNLFLESVIEVVAVRHDLHLAGAFCALRKFLRRIQVAQLLAAPDVQSGTGDAGRELQDVGSVPQVEETLGGDGVPPAREEHEFPAGSPAGPCLGFFNELIQAVLGEEPGLA